MYSAVRESVLQTSVRSSRSTAFKSPYFLVDLLFSSSVHY